MHILKILVAALVTSGCSVKSSGGSNAPSQPEPELVTVGQEFSVSGPLRQDGEGFVLQKSVRVELPENTTYLLGKQSVDSVCDDQALGEQVALLQGQDNGIKLSNEDVEGFLIVKDGFPGAVPAAKYLLTIAFAGLKSCDSVDARFVLEKSATSADAGAAGGGNGGGNSGGNSGANGGGAAPVPAGISLSELSGSWSAATGYLKRGEQEMEAKGISFRLALLANSKVSVSYSICASLRSCSGGDLWARAEGTLEGNSIKLSCKNNGANTTYDAGGIVDGHFQILLPNTFGECAGFKHSMFVQRSDEGEIVLMAQDDYYGQALSGLAVIQKAL